VIQKRISYFIRNVRKNTHCSKKYTKIFVIVVEMLHICYMKEKEIKISYGDIKKIAEESSKSRWTVSRFLRGENVTLNTAKAIIEAIEKLNSSEKDN